MVLVIPDVRHKAHTSQLGVMVFITPKATQAYPVKPLHLCTSAPLRYNFTLGRGVLLLCLFACFVVNS
jgi:hypothetical protein